MMRELPETILKSRRELAVSGQSSAVRSEEAEGGCGVIGLASSNAIKGKYLITPCTQMCNRGNGKGGGVAVVGCFPNYADHYAVQVGYLDLDARQAIEQAYIFPNFDVAHRGAAVHRRLPRVPASGDRAAARRALLFARQAGGA